METKFKDVKVGISPIGWTNDELFDIGDRYTYENIIDDMAILKFQGCELGRKFPKDVKILKPELEKRNLELVTGWGEVAFMSQKYADAYYKKFTRHVDFLNEMGCKYAVCAEICKSEIWDPEKPETCKKLDKLTNEQYKYLGEKMNEAGLYCKNKGMELVYHVHAESVIETIEETYKLINACDKELVYLLSDTGQCAFLGEDPVEFVREFIGSIKYMHLKDVKFGMWEICRENGFDYNTSMRLGIFTVPGDGDIDFETIFKMLADKKYKGWLMIEADTDSRYNNPMVKGKCAQEYIMKKTNLTF